MYARKENILNLLKLSAYLSTSKRNILAIEVKLKVKSQGQVCVAGRIMALRKYGKLLFADLYDSTGRVQLVLKANLVKNFDKICQWLNVGDIIEAKGKLGETNTNEPSVFVKKIYPLAVCRSQIVNLKSLSLRFSNRSMDLISNTNSREVLKARSLILKSIRNTIEDQGFLESHTPVLQPQYGGGTSEPFQTFCNSLNIRMFLRTTSELYLKQLIIGGFERVYEMGKCFRNEGYSKQYIPEFLMLEAYCAYAELEDMIKIVRFIFKSVQKTIITFNPALLNQLLKPNQNWTELTYKEACFKFLGISWSDYLDLNSAKSVLSANNLKPPKTTDPGLFHLKVTETLLAPKLNKPTIIKYLPTVTSPLMRCREKCQEELERALAFINGICFCDIASELNDPDELTNRLQKQKLILQDIHNYSNINFDFLRALKLGMPPVGGIGFGIERFIMAILDKKHIREVIPFPLNYMKIKKNENQ